MSSSADRRAIDDVVAVLRGALERGQTAGAAGVDDAVRRLVAGRVERAIAGTTTVTADDVAAALEPSATAATVAGRLGRAGGRLARRSRTARALVGRTPTGLALRWGPLLVDVVGDNLRAVDAVAGHLVSRARAVGVEPDTDRLRRAVVQALVGDPIDPVAAPDHARLARTWIGTIGRRAAPLGLGAAGARSRRTPADVVSRLGGVDVRTLAPDN